MTTALRGILRSDRFVRLVTPQAIDPLTVDEYIKHVLVLEVAVKLISEDMLQPREDDEEPYTEKEKRQRALQILKESREYGRLRFGIGSDYLAEEDQANGATQMVLADVRGYDDDSEDEDDEDAQSSSGGEEEQQQAPSERQQSPPVDSAPSDDEAPVCLQLESSPQEVEDDDDVYDGERPASREILALASSPIQSPRPSHRRSSSTFIVESPVAPLASASQVDTRLKPVTIIDDAEDDFDVPCSSLDEQELINIANNVEETHHQQQKRKENAPVNGWKRPRPKFAAQVHVSPERTLTLTGNAGGGNGGPSRRPVSTRNLPAVVHDVDGDDPLAANLNHRNLLARTQARQTPQDASSGASNRDRSTNGSGTNGTNRYGSNQTPAQGYNSRRNNNASGNDSPYFHLSTMQGARRVGLSKKQASRPGTTGRGSRDPLFHKPKTAQALANRQQAAQVYDAMARK